MANHAAHIDFLVKWEVVPSEIPAADVVRVDLVDGMNSLDQAEFEAWARVWKP